MKADPPEWFAIPPNCISCGDPTAKQIGAPLHFTEKERLIWISHCWECALELLFGRIPHVRAKIFPSGHGCPLEPNDDASPWQENAIREMERDSDE